MARTTIITTITTNRAVQAVKAVKLVKPVQLAQLAQLVTPASVMLLSPHVPSTALNHSHNVASLPKSTKPPYLASLQVLTIVRLKDMCDAAKKHTGKREELSARAASCWVDCSNPVAQCGNTQDEYEIPQHMTPAWFH